MAMQEFSRSLPMMLYRTLDAVMPRFRRIFKEFGLTEQQWRVLRVLWQEKRITFRELAELTLISAPSLVGVIDRLSANGLVDRNPSETDRRSVVISATRKGHALEAKVRPRVDKAYSDLCACVDADSWETLIAGLERVAALESKKTQSNSVANL